MLKYCKSYQANCNRLKIVTKRVDRGSNVCGVREYIGQTVCSTYCLGDEKAGRGRCKCSKRKPQRAGGGGGCSVRNSTTVLLRGIACG
jgi:hypothetical protein